MVSLIYQDSKKVELIGAKSRLAVARGWGEGQWGESQRAGRFSCVK